MDQIWGAGGWLCEGIDIRRGGLVGLGAGCRSKLYGVRWFSVVVSAV